MRTQTLDDLTLPLIIEADDSRPRRTRLTAFVPIAVALVGVLFILLGGIKVETSAVTIGAAENVDPVVTGSIDAADRIHDLIMLDR